MKHLVPRVQYVEQAKGLPDRFLVDGLQLRLWQQGRKTHHYDWDKAALRRIIQQQRKITQTSR